MAEQTSFVCIDRERMHVLYKHPDQALIVSLANLEVPHVSCCFFSITDTSFSQFTPLELKLLYTNMCGLPNPGYERHNMAHAAVQLCMQIPDMVLNPIEVNAQLNLITGQQADGQYYKFVPGSVTPSKQQDLYHPAALVTVAGYVPSKTTLPANMRPGAATSGPSTSPSGPAAPRAPRAPSTPSAPRPPRDPNAPVSEAPKAGSKTGRVWDTADAQLATHPERPVDLKGLRKEIWTICEADGTPSGTFSVQFGKWKASRGL